MYLNISPACQMYLDYAIHASAIDVYICGLAGAHMAIALTIKGQLIIHTIKHILISHRGMHGRTGTSLESRPTGAGEGHSIRYIDVIVSRDTQGSGLRTAFDAAPKFTRMDIGSAHWWTILGVMPVTSP